MLPTGLGKTIVALLYAGLIVADMADDYNYGIIVMVSPTRALLVQHHELFEDRLAIGKENLVACDDGLEFGEDVTKEMVMDWVERFADLAGIKVIATSNARVLARVVQDFHEHMRDETHGLRMKRGIIASSISQ